MLINTLFLGGWILVTIVGSGILYYEEKKETQKEKKERWL